MSIPEVNIKLQTQDDRKVTELGESRGVRVLLVEDSVPLSIMIVNLCNHNTFAEQKQCYVFDSSSYKSHPPLV